MGTLHSIAYFSRNRMAVSGDELRQEIAQILETARSNNARKGVTGALLFNRGCFAQVLEGPLQAVETIFENIQCDPRHGDVTVLHHHPIAERGFSEWSMAFAGFDADLADEAAALSIDGPDAIPTVADGSRFVAVLQDLCRRNSEM